MPAKFRDYYETLGVSKSATADEIKSAFRKLARKFHPDTAEDKKSAEEKFKEINEAYEVLGDPEKRQKYDDYGEHWERVGAGGPGGGSAAWPPRGGQGASYQQTNDGGVEFEFGGTGFSDFFEQMFGARRAGGVGQGFGAAGPHRGNDVEADLLVTLEEAFHGSTRKISFRRSDTQNVQTYTVKVPKAVREGQRIRLAGQGGPGAHGGTAGDLYLVVKFQKHPEFEVDGTNLVIDLSVPAWKCVLGGEAEVQTLEGKARIRIPAGTQSGRRMRLASRGLPDKSGGRGDLYVRIVAELPANPDEAELALWKQLAALEK